MPTRFERLQAATAEDFRSQVLGHPIGERLRRGEIGLGHYVAWLRETWHLVRHTPGIFARAAARVPLDQPALRSWFLRQAGDENGHDLLCVKDLRTLGLDPDEVLQGQPGRGVWGAITQDWYFAEHAPVGLLGTNSVSEELGATVAAPILAALGAGAVVPAGATGFIRAHGSHDRRHFDEAARSVDELASDADFDLLVHARRMAIRCCAQQLDDVLATDRRDPRPDEPGQRAPH